MYPPPSSLYRPQVPQQPPQLISQTMNQNVHPSLPLPPGPPSSSAYPYQHSNYNSNSATSGHPGQPLLVPQSMPYAMGGSTTGATNQQNNLNGPLTVRMSI